MGPIKILTFSPNKEFKKEIQHLLSDYGSLKYEFLKTDERPNGIEPDIVLFDEDSIDAEPQKYLAQYIFELSPAPVIYICKNLDLPVAYSAVKSLAADYLFKDQLSSSGLHNCIKYAIEATRLKNEIDKQQKRYQSLFHNAVDPAFFLNSDWKIENLNQAFTDVFNTSLHTLLGEDFTDLFCDPKDAKQLKSWFDNNSSSVFETETQFLKTGNRETFPGHLKVSVLREYTLADGENTKHIVGYHGTLSNNSDRRRLNKFREVSERLDMTYRLARTLAHEIRNPLTNITLSLNQLEDEVEHTADVKVYFNIIERCTTRIDRLIDQLLHSSQREDMTGGDCDLVEITKSAIEEAKDRAKLRHIKLITDFESDAIPYFCDAEKLTLALSNLITNAIESIEGDSGQVIVGTYLEGNYFYIYVEDNGIGMDENQKKSLFDPFYTSKPKGLGMGLTATQGIILEHKGQIEVESEKGVGSTFTIQLPKSELNTSVHVNNP